MLKNIILYHSLKNFLGLNGFKAGFKWLFKKGLFKGQFLLFYIKFQNKFLSLQFFSL